MTFKRPNRPDLPRVVAYAVCLCGFGAFLAGCWNISHHLALIVGGGVVCVAGFLAGLNRDPHHLKDKDW